MKTIRHSKLPLILHSADHLTPDMLKAIQIQMAEYNWDDWIDEDGNWFKYWNKPNRKQLELFDDCVDPLKPKLSTSHKQQHKFTLTKSR